MAINEGLITLELALRIINSIAGRLGVEFDAAEELEKAEKEAEDRAEDDVYTDDPLGVDQTQDGLARRRQDAGKTPVNRIKLA